MLKPVFSLLLLMSPLSFVFAGEDLDSAARTQVIERLATLLQQEYVFEEVGIQVGDFVKQRQASGAYAQLSDPEAFAQQLTQDVQSVSKDKHMTVRHRPPSQIQQRGSGAERMVGQLRQKHAMFARNNGVPTASVLEGNVGYLEVRSFEGRVFMAPRVDQAMAMISNVEAVILDLRRNGGGQPDTVRYLCSYFLPPGTHVNSIYQRAGDQTQEFWSEETLPGKRLLDVPLYILTSHKTFSGGEGCAYNLQALKRATLIGEITGGGANPGGRRPLGFNLSIFVPNGRAVNPVTGTNWEGVGVIPHVKISAEKAYDLALARAQADADQRREKREQAAADLGEQLESALNALADLAASESEAQAKEPIFKLLEQGIKSEFLDEPSINMMGYGRLGRGNLATAEALMQFNAKTFATSANTYDSWGEVLAARGRLDEALACYKKAVILAQANNDANLAIYKQGLDKIRARIKTQTTH